jgi:hypothetical protein
MCRIRTLNRKRSSCAAGSGNVPTRSSGFCVATTKNRSSSLRVLLSTVTCFSPMASSIALCTLGDVRLISSASTMCAKIGPGRNEELRGVRVEDERARHVGRQHVGRELDAAERRRSRRRPVVDDRVAERLRERRLARARVVLEQHVAVREQRDEQHLDDVVAPAHRAREPLVEALVHAEGARQVGGARRRLAHHAAAPVHIHRHAPLASLSVPQGRIVVTSIAGSSGG